MSGKNKGFVMIPTIVLDSFDNSKESRTLRVYCAIARYYSMTKKSDGSTFVNRPFPGHKVIATMLKISVAQVKKDIELLTQIRASDNQPLLVKKNRYNPEEKKFSSNIYILPHLEETIKYAKTI